LNELDSCRSIRGDPEASDRHEVQVRSSEIVGNLRRRLKDGSSAYPTVAKARAT
jgi:hypothetical protein